MTPLRACLALALVLAAAAFVAPHSAHALPATLEPATFEVTGGMIHPSFDPVGNEEPDKTRRDVLYNPAYDCIIAQHIATKLREEAAVAQLLSLRYPSPKPTPLCDGLGAPAYTHRHNELQHLRLQIAAGVSQPTTPLCRNGTLSYPSSRQRRSATISVTAPTSGQNFAAGTRMVIGWDSFEAGPVFNLYLVRTDTLAVQSTVAMGDSFALSGGFSRPFAVPGATPAGSYRILVESGSVAGVSGMSAAFNVVAPTRLTVTYPAADTTVNTGDTVLIEWIVAGSPPANLQMYLLYGGSTRIQLEVVSSTPTAAGQYSWVVPNTVPTGDYWIAVVEPGAFTVLASVPPNTGSLGDQSFRIVRPTCANHGVCGETEYCAYSGACTACDQCATRADAVDGFCPLKCGGELPNVGDRLPDVSEDKASGSFRNFITPGCAAFDDLVENGNTDIIFADGTSDSSPRIMTSRLASRLNVLASSVMTYFGGDERLVVTRAYEAPPAERSNATLHNEGRAADITLHLAPSEENIAVLVSLAAQTGFDWVYFASSTSVHVSVIPDRCQAPLDLIFLLDGSGSVDSIQHGGEPGTFATKMLTFVKQVVQFFDIGADETRVGVATFSSGDATHTTINLQLNTFFNKSQIMDAIDDIEYPGLGTWTKEALETVRDQMFTSASGMRAQAEGVSRVLVVITDGKSNTNHEPGAVAAELHADNINVFAIGVGGYEISELQDMASDPDDSHVFTLASFNQISSLVEEMSSVTCDAAAIITAGTRTLSEVEGCEVKYFRPTCGILTNLRIELTTTSGLVHLYVSRSNANPSAVSYDFKDESSDAIKVIDIVREEGDTEPVYIAVVGVFGGTSTFELDIISDVFQGESHDTVAVDENTPAGELPKVIFTPPSLSDLGTWESDFRFTLANNYDGRFGIGVSDGVVSLLKALDAEEAAEYRLRIEAKDLNLDCLSGAFDLSVQVGDLNDNAPEVVSDIGLVANVDEGRPAGTEVLGITVRDLDRTGINSEMAFALTEDGGGNFDIVVAPPGSGSERKRKRRATEVLVTVVTTAVLDYEAQSNFTVKFTASDTGSPPQVATVTVSVGVNKVLCPAGQASSTGSLPCTPCVAGSTFSPSPGTVACIPCGCGSGQITSGSCTATQNYECSDCTAANSEVIDNVCQCADGYYDAGSASGGPMDCQPCRSSCPTGQRLAGECTPTSNPTCETCDACGAGQYESSPCVCEPCSSTCPAGEYMTRACGDGLNAKCSPCTTAEDCAGNQYFVGGCQVGGVDVDSECKDCPLDCATCDGPDTCTSCPGEKLLTPAGECVDPGDGCPDGTYPDPTNGVCGQCDTSCLTCDGGGLGDCLSCGADMLKLGTQCVVACPAGYYIGGAADNECVLCNTCGAVGVEYEARACVPTSTLDRLCNTVSQCVLNSTYETAAPGASSDRVCSPVSPACGADYDETAVPTLTSDRVCEKVDDCLSSPCLNGGTCVDGVRNYTCQCLDGFSGSECQDFDSCFINPCAAGSTCVSDASGSYCLCAAAQSCACCDQATGVCNSTETAGLCITKDEAVDTYIGNSNKSSGGGGGGGAFLLVGAGIGGLIVLMLLVLLVLVLLKRRSQKGNAKLGKVPEIDDAAWDNAAVAGGYREGRAAGAADYGELDCENTAYKEANLRGGAAGEYEAVADGAEYDAAGNYDADYAMGAAGEYDPQYDVGGYTGEGGYDAQYDVGGYTGEDGVYDAAGGYGYGDADYDMGAGGGQEYTDVDEFGNELYPLAQESAEYCQVGDGGDEYYNEYDQAQQGYGDNPDYDFANMQAAGGAGGYANRTQEGDYQNHYDRMRRGQAGESDYAMATGGSEPLYDQGTLGQDDVIYDRCGQTTLSFVAGSAAGAGGPGESNYDVASNMYGQNQEPLYATASGGAGGGLQLGKRGQNFVVDEEALYAMANGESGTDDAIYAMAGSGVEGESTYAMASGGAGGESIYAMASGGEGGESIYAMASGGKGGEGGAGASGEPIYAMATMQALGLMKKGQGSSRRGGGGGDAGAEPLYSTATDIGNADQDNVYALAQGSGGGGGGDADYQMASDLPDIHISVSAGAGEPQRTGSMRSAASSAMSDPTYDIRTLMLGGGSGSSRRKGKDKDKDNEYAMADSLQAPEYEMGRSASPIYTLAGEVGVEDGAHTAPEGGAAQYHLAQPRRGDAGSVSPVYALADQVGAQGTSTDSSTDSSTDCDNPTYDMGVEGAEAPPAAVSSAAPAAAEQPRKGKLFKWRKNNSKTELQPSKPSSDSLLHQPVARRPPSVDSTTPPPGTIATPRSSTADFAGEGGVVGGGKAAKVRRQAPKPPQSK